MQRKIWIVSFVVLMAVVPRSVMACACGCGIFDVGTGAMIPTGEGGTFWLEFDRVDQDRNWSGSGPADPDRNENKRILTLFYTAGFQYMFSRAWGLVVEVPYWDRELATAEDDGPVETFSHGALGDIRLKAVYAGFSEDMSSGLTLGLKLPTGDYSHPEFDKDTQIGTGSTDLILGGYHMGPLDADRRWIWFARGQWEHALATRDGYRPGDETNLVGGVYYNRLSVGSGKLVPLAQLIVSIHQRDEGTGSEPENTGYVRYLASPGLEYDWKGLRLYGDVQFGVHQHVNGDQLVAPVQYRITIGYSF